MRGSPTSHLPVLEFVTSLAKGGVGANGFAPPDPNLAVGPNQIVQIVNVEYAVYDKSGTIFAGYPKTVGSLFSALGGDCTGARGDVIVQYDREADRWLISQWEAPPAPPTPSVSRFPKPTIPTAAYNLYSYSFGNDLNDYPKIGVWPTSTNSAYTATFNLFAGGAQGIGAAVCAIDRAGILSGAPSPVMICFTISNDYSYLPSDLDGSTLPPAGLLPVFLTLETQSSLRYYQMTPDFANPGSSTLSAPTDIVVASFSEPCNNTGGTCIPQPGTSQQLDSLGDRPMYRLAYRNFGDHDALVFNHSVTAGSGVGVRWYELRETPPGSGPLALYQQGTFAPDSTYRWMGSAAMDLAGDIAIGYSASSSSVFPSIRYTGRIPTDPSGTMRAETSMLVGSGSQTGGLSRWGDYSALRIDPSDDCTFWYTNQYEPSSGSFNWATFVGSFKFSNCGGASPDFSISATPGSQTVTAGGSTSYTVSVSPLNGFNGTVGLSVTAGLPPGATASFNPTSVTGSGNSTMAVTTSSSTPAGTYTITITGTSGSLSHTTTVGLIVNAAAQPDFSLSASPSSVTVTQGNQGTSTITVTSLNGFNGTVGLSVTAGLPSGASASFNPTSVSGSGNSTMTVTTSSSTPTGTYRLTITGTSGSLTHTTTVTLVVNPASSGGDFSLSVSPSSQTVTAGGSVSYTASVSPSGGFTGSVTLSVSGLPSGASATFGTNPINGGSGTTTMRVSTSSSTPTGTYTLKITGTSGSLTHSTTVAMVVNAFSISASPSSETVTRGNNATYTATVTSFNGFNGTVTFSVRGLPSNSTASFNPSSVIGWNIDVDDKHQLIHINGDVLSENQGSQRRRDP